MSVETMRYYIKQRFGSDHMTVELRDRILEEMSQEEIEQIPHIGTFIDPSKKEKLFLSALYNTEKADTSFYKQMLYQSGYENSIPVSLAMLEFAGVADVKRRLWTNDKGVVLAKPADIVAHHEVMEGYWSGIGEWYEQIINESEEQYHFKKTKAGRNERIRQALKLLGKNSLEELTEEDIPEIDNLSRIDWKINGWDLPRASVGGIKKKLRDYVNNHK